MNDKASVDRGCSTPDGGVGVAAQRSVYIDMLNLQRSVQFIAREQWDVRSASGVLQDAELQLVCGAADDARSGELGRVQDYCGG